MARDPSKLIAVSVTVAVLAIAILLGGLLYLEYQSNPWTRDAHLRADVIAIAARVQGPIVDLAIKDNERVQKGQLLFEIDPTDYMNAAAIAQSTLDQRTAELNNAREQLERRQRLFDSKVIAKEEIDTATANFQAAKAAYEGAANSLRQAKLNISYTKVFAPANGYVTGLTFGAGTYVQTGQPLFALIDSDSYYLTAYFKETVLKNLEPGRSVSIHFAPRPFEGFNGTIESLGWAIYQADASTQNLLPNVAPTVDWVRLTQRYPVRIRLDAEVRKLPLKIGVTASVRVRDRSDSSEK